MTVIASSSFSELYKDPPQPNNNGDAQGNRDDADDNEFYRPNTGQ